MDPEFLVDILILVGVWILVAIELADVLWEKLYKAIDKLEDYDGKINIERS